MAFAEDPEYTPGWWAVGWGGALRYVILPVDGTAAYVCAWTGADEQYGVYCGGWATYCG
jgi:hypothetical protein